MDTVSQPVHSQEGAPSGARHRAVVCMMTSLLLGLTYGLGLNLVNVNLTAIQGTLGATAVESNWLLTAYYTTNLSAILLLFKVRMQFGLVPFADLGIVVFLILSITQLFVHHLGLEIMMRAALGLASAAISSLTILYMLEAFPESQRVFGLLLGFLNLQLGAPLSRIISENLLEIGLWRGLQFVDIGLAVLSLAAINIVRLTPVPLVRTFNRGDEIAFPVYACSLALFSIVLTQGRSYWWTDAQWLGICLATAIGLAGLFVLIELHRDEPMLDLRWLARPFMIRFFIATLLVRIVLAEQSVGAVGLLNAAGLNNDQMHGLFGWILLGTVAGFLLTIIAVLFKKVDLPGLAAPLLIIIAAVIDSFSTGLTRSGNFYFTQLLLATATSLFLSSTLVIGITQVLKSGTKYLISFISIFVMTQSLGSLMGTALFSTFLADRQKLHYAAIVEHLALSDPQVSLRIAQLSGAFARVSPDPTQRAASGLATFAQQVNRESFVLAYNDVFQLVAIIAAYVFVVLLIIKLVVARRAYKQLQPDGRTH